MLLNDTPSHKSRKAFIWMPIVIALVATGVFFLIQLITQTGFFRVPGVIYYDDSLTQSELNSLQDIFTDDLQLYNDLTISASSSFQKPTLQEGEFLIDILVPVTDFYNVNTSISSQDLSALQSGSTSVDARLISIDNLDSSRKLLAVDDQYYLDTFTSGAIFRTLKFESESYNEEVAPLVAKTFTKTYPSQASVLTFAQTGVTALSRGMYQKLQSVGDATFFSAKIADFLSDFDITHTSNESSFSEYATADNICSDWDFTDTLLDIGLDTVELTGNHNQDCGDTAAKDSIEWYQKQGISIVGGGKTADEAATPLQISQKNTNITFLAYNESTGGATTDATPGANQYYEDNADAEISAAKARGDFVIVDVQYYECSAYASEYEDPTCDYADSSAGDQIGFFRHLIDLGADLVVGTSAHQPQTFELYGSGTIYYGLGNLFFDQVWWPGTTRSLVLGHYFYNGKLLQTKITATAYDNNMQTEILDESSTAYFLQRLINARPTPEDPELHALIEDWSKQVGGTNSVVVYDLDRSKTLAYINPSTSYNMASLYKLFVVYEGYRRLENGTWNANDFLETAGHDRLTCLDLAIRESNSDCAEALWNEIGRENLNYIALTDFGVSNTDLSNLISNPTDITTMMGLFFYHPDLHNEEYIARIKDSLLNQPVTEYDWRQGLPAGFSDSANVYDKVGWNWTGEEWDIYHDAAILEFPSLGRHFLVTVMTNHVSNTDIAKLGTKLENYLISTEEL